MKIISILIITIIISIVLSSSINNDNKYLKSSSLLKAADNLDKCGASKIASFAEFVKANFPNYSIYSKSEDSKTYSYISTDRIMVVNLKTAGKNDEFSTIDIYTYTDTKKTDNVICDIVGTPIIHYGFDATGKKLSEKTIFYEDGDNLQEQIYIQLRQVTSGARDPSYTVYSTCDNTPITDLPDLIVKAKEFLDLDHAISYIATDKRDSTLTYDDIKTKRLSILNDKKYKTFYTKDNNICSITYDGSNTYTIYHTELATGTVTFTGTGLKVIPEGTSKQYIITCEGDNGIKVCKDPTPSSVNPIDYTVVKRNEEPKELYVFRDKVLYGTNKKTTEIKMEKTALEKVNKIWASCGIDIKEEPNSIKKYTYNIIILIILSFIYMI